MRSRKGYKMSIKKKSIEELELMSYTDIAYEIIKEDKKKYDTKKLFKEVCKLLKLSDAEFEEKIGDFFTASAIACSRPPLPTTKIFIS